MLAHVKQSAQFYPCVKLLGMDFPILDLTNNESATE